ncbi:MAG: hypothetical protein IPJ51_20775 [Saprospiraceae bacterium]|nr:hypothetical protein [Saprospiraceae bacterium]
MDTYIALKVESTEEILMALLTQFEFESFEENDDHFIAYINEKIWMTSPELTFQKLFNHIQTSFLLRL